MSKVEQAHIDQYAAQAERQGHFGIAAALRSLRAPPSAGHEAPGCAFCMGHGSGLSPGDLCPKCGDLVPGGLPLDLSHVPADMAEAVEMLRRARDRLAEYHKGMPYYDQWVAVGASGLSERIAALQSELAEMTACSLAASSRADAAQSELAQATARAEQDAKDAARYRWLRSGYTGAHLDSEYKTTCLHFKWPHGATISVHSLDVAIDAALASGTGAASEGRG